LDKLIQMYKSGSKPKTFTDKIGMTGDKESSSQLYNFCNLVNKALFD